MPFHERGRVQGRVHATGFALASGWPDRVRTTRLNTPWSQALFFLLELAPSASSQLTLPTPPLECVKIRSEIHIVRTNIEIDDQLMSDALRLTGARTKREAVEMGLLTLLRLRQQEEIRRFRGKLQWEGDLDAMRTDA